MKTNELQKDLLVGSLLGDGNLQTANKGKNWRYRAIQQAAHHEYLFHKYEILKPLCRSAPFYGETVDARTGTKSKRWSFNSVIQDLLKYYGDMFYTFDPNTQRMVKDVPLEIGKLLTPRALAYLYMDDGALKWLGHSNAMRICTESFSEEGVNRLIKAIKDNYGIETNTVASRRSDRSLIGFRIFIPERSSGSL